MHSTSPGDSPCPGTGMPQGGHWSACPTAPLDLEHLGGSECTCPSPHCLAHSSTWSTLTRKLGFGESLQQPLTWHETPVPLNDVWGTALPWPSDSPSAQQGPHASRPAHLVAVHDLMSSEGKPRGNDAAGSDATTAPDRRGPAQQCWPGTDWRWGG